MKFTSTTITRPLEILKFDHFIGVPQLLDFALVAVDPTEGVKVVKAGTPINALGVSDNTATAKGILLTDTYEGNPNATLVIHGFIDQAKAQANSTVVIAALVKTALVQVAFL